MQQAAACDVQETDDDLNEAKRRLEGWGAWLRAVTIRSLGYPNHAAFTQEPSGGTVDYDDDDAEEIETLLARMMNMPARVMQYKVLVQEYHFNATVRDGRERVRDDIGRKLSLQGYLNERDKGVHYIAGVLAGRRR